MPSEELTNWIAFYEYEPFGTERDDWRFAMLASVMASIFASKKSKKPKISDFMPRRKKRKRVDTDEIKQSAIQLLGIKGKPNAD